MQGVSDYVSKIKNTTGFGYWNGTFGQIATEQLWNENKARLPDWYNAHANAKTLWMGKRILDCAGLDKYARWVQADGNVKYDSSTDLNEQMLFDKAKAMGCKWGTIDTIPDVAGIVVWKSGHMGIYIGNGVSRESRGGDYGVKDYDYKTRGWTHWYYNPFINYSKGEITMQKGDTGDSVKIWQEALLKCGYKMINSKGQECSADGDFGGGTVNGTNLFKADEGLAQDGIVDADAFCRMIVRMVRFQSEESKQLVQNFLDKSNEVVSLKQNIADLEQMKNELEKELVLAADDTELKDVKQQLDVYKLKLIQTEEELKILKEQTPTIPNPYDITRFTFAELLSECIKRIGTAFKKK